VIRFIDLVISHLIACYGHNIALQRIDTLAKEGDDEEEDGPVPDIDEGDLGEDVFAQPLTDGGAQVETWHGTDRDYTYPEVRFQFIASYSTPSFDTIT
jgi:hypothetical protein